MKIAWFIFQWYSAKINVRRSKSWSPKIDNVVIWNSSELNSEWKNNSISYRKKTGNCAKLSPFLSVTPWIRRRLSDFRRQSSPKKNYSRMPFPDWPGLRCKFQDLSFQPIRCEYLKKKFSMKIYFIFQNSLHELIENCFWILFVLDWQRQRQITGWMSFGTTLHAVGSAIRFEQRNGDTPQRSNYRNPPGSQSNGQFGWILLRNRQTPTGRDRDGPACCTGSCESR